MINHSGYLLSLGGKFSLLWLRKHSPQLLKFTHCNLSGDIQLITASSEIKWQKKFWTQLDLTGHIFRTTQLRTVSPHRADVSERL